MQEPQTEFNPNGEPQFARLEERRLKEFPYEEDGDPYFHLRLRRSVSWLGRAEQFFHSKPQDLDTSFTCYWIAFNALYVNNTSKIEETQINGYIGWLLRYDNANELRNAFQDKVSTEAALSFMDNQFLYQRFWNYHQNRRRKYRNWESKFKQESKEVRSAIARISQNDASTSDVRCALQLVLRRVFERMYVLRNQTIHGSATWGSDRNRENVGEGTRIMALFVPLFIELMMDNPKEARIYSRKPRYTLPKGAI